MRFAKSRFWAQIPTMKRVILSAVGLIAVVSAGFTDAFLENDTGTTLYVREIGQLEYRHIPDGGVLPVPTDTVFEGFAFESGEFLLPTFAINTVLVAENSVLTVTVQDLFDSPTIEASAVAEVVSGPRLDNRYLEWLAVEPLFARARGRTALGSFLNTADGRVALEPAAALQWQRGGTDLEWVKTKVVEQDLFLSATSYSEYSRSTYLSLYLYGQGLYPVATLQIEPGVSRAYVLLWTPTQPEPIVVGNSVATDYFIESQIWLDVVQSVVEDLNAVEILEISTVASIPGRWEEYVLARISAQSVVKP